MHAVAVLHRPIDSYSRNLHGTMKVYWMARYPLLTILLAPRENPLVRPIRLPRSVVPRAQPPIGTWLRLPRPCRLYVTRVVRLHQIKVLLPLPLYLLHPPIRVRQGHSLRILTSHHYGILSVLVYDKTMKTKTKTKMTLRRIRRIRLLKRVTVVFVAVVVVVQMEHRRQLRRSYPPSARQVERVPSLTRKHSS